MDTKDIFQPYDKLVEIEILGEQRRVPENNSLLRCFQFLAMETISYGDLCWNGSCDNCLVSLKKRGQEKVVMACRTMVKEGMKVVRVADALDLSGG